MKNALSVWAYAVKEIMMTPDIGIGISYTEYIVFKAVCWHILQQLAIIPKIVVQQK